MSFTVISQIYIVSTVVGSGFMLLSTALGGMRHGGGHHSGGHVHSGHAGHGGHGGTGHGAAGHASAGHGGGVKAIAHSGPAGHSGSGGHNGGGHGAASHAANAGHNVAAGHSANAAHNAAASHNGSSAHTGNAQHAGAAGHGTTGHAPAIDGSAGTQAGPPLGAMATTGPVMSEPSGIITRALGKVHGLHVELKDESILEVILGFMNPMSIATFMTFFGVVGFIVSVAFNFPIFISLPIAALAGWVAVQIMIHVIAWLFENLGSSSEAKMGDLVGRMAEVTLPIGEGKLGEVTYIIKSKRYSSPAKSVNPTLALSKRTKVMISEVADHVMLVEPWTDSFIDPGFDSPAVH